MRVLMLLAAAALAGCTLPGAPDGVLLVHARDMVAVHGDGGDAVEGQFGPHCRHAVVEDDGRRLTLRYELADEPPRALLVRAFEVFARGAMVPTVSADKTGHHRLGPGVAPVPAPFAGAPALLEAWVDGEAVHLGDHVLRPGENASISFSYQVRGRDEATSADVTLDVEETLVVRHLGRVPATAEKGLSCA